MKKAQIKERAYVLSMAIYWIAWTSYVVAKDVRFFMVSLVIYAAWHLELRDWYAKWIGTRYSVVLMHMGSPIACRECSFNWTAQRAAKKLARDYGWLQLNYPPEATSVIVCATHVEIG